MCRLYLQLEQKHHLLYVMTFLKLEEGKRLALQNQQLEAGLA